MAKLIDLFALAIVAFVLLLPQPTVVFSPGFAGDKSDLDRIAVLEDSLYRKKDDVEVAVDLARAYLRIEQPVWAIATLRPYKGAGSYQVHQVLATAYATVLRFDLGLAEAESGMAQCESQGPRCPEVTQIRLGYLANLMRENAQKGIDASTDPVAAKRMVQAALRATKAQLPESTPTSSPPVKPTSPPADKPTTPPPADKPTTPPTAKP